MNQILDALDARSRNIVTRRYGIATGVPETLESIGKEYGITRERVRQIQSHAKRILRETGQVLADVERMFNDLFSKHGGILTEDHVVTLLAAEIGQEVKATTVGFFLDVLPAYKYLTHDSFFAPHWRNESLLSEHIDQVAQAALELLEARNHPVSERELISGIVQKLAQNNIVVPEQHIYAQLMASAKVQKTAFAEWGHTDWPETNPRGVGDKAYAVLRRHGKPEHFTLITDLINKAQFDHKRANAQTVHNELIKDDRFVLVGRGLYGLTEWGFIPGTVADVIESLLTQAGKPLSREEVIARVMEQRQVKKNTILLGLQNQDRFIRTGEDHYTLRQGS